MNTTVRKIGNSHGIIIPKDLLDKLHLREGDELELVEVDGRLQIVPSEDDFSRQMRAARFFMDKYHDTLAKLAK